MNATHRGMQGGFHELQSNENLNQLHAIAVSIKPGKSDNTDAGVD